MPHVAEEIFRLFLPARILTGGKQAQVQPVELLPHVDTDLLAHLAGVLAGVRDALEQRLLALADREIDGQQVEVHLPGALRVEGLQGAEQTDALPRRRFRRAVRGQADADLEQACRVFGALEIAAQPVQVVGHAREHLLATSTHSSTHVSLLPPPCEELTTSDPRRRATRVRPPGTMTVC